MLKKSKNTFKENLEFIKLITDRGSTAMNVKSTGYFSPYINHNVKLNPKVKKILDEIINRKDYKPLLLSSPPKELHEIINHKWQNIKYENSKN